MLRAIRPTPSHLFRHPIHPAAALLPRRLGRPPITFSRPSCSPAAAPRMSAVAKADVAFDRAKLEDLLLKRFFYVQAFEIYGGPSGLCS